VCGHKAGTSPALLNPRLSLQPSPLSGGIPLDLCCCCRRLRSSSVSLFGVLASGMESGGLKNRGKGKMNHNFHRGSLCGRTGWASHSLGPPSCFSLPHSSIKQAETAHIPLERGGADAVASGFLSERWHLYFAHILQERKGATFQGFWHVVESRMEWR